MIGQNIVRSRPFHTLVWRLPNILAFLIELRTPTAYCILGTDCADAPLHVPAPHRPIFGVDYSIKDDTASYRQDRVTAVTRTQNHTTRTKKQWLIEPQTNDVSLSWQDY
ncbi:hypothetical protein DL546_006051 [Coniochaeta pulveracea]|uniref:Uncharacterized protein n=1 Tax=Coniochaeta pulveracea TaxID=177199 RepID=A0A420Y4X9_9PEZI|nr:hypothetical protein DL546_006051 [Coniochaeta pulveracea]